MIRPAVILRGLSAIENLSDDGSRLRRFLPPLRDFLPLFRLIRFSRLRAGCYRCRFELWQVWRLPWKNETRYLAAWRPRKWNQNWLVLLNKRLAKVVLDDFDGTGAAKRMGGRVEDRED